MTLPGTLAAAVMGPAIASAAGPERASGQSASAILESSIRTVEGRRDLAALKSMKLGVRTITSHLADGDHPDAPFAVDYADSEWLEDLAGGRRLAVTASRRATGDLFESRVLSTPELVQSAFKRGDTAFPLQATPSAPDWQFANPVRALLLAREARDLRLLSPTTVHSSPVDVLAFSYRGFPVKLFISHDNRLPLAVETRIVLKDFGNIAWAARGDLTDRTEWMNWDLVGGIRFPLQWDTSRNGMDYQTVTVLDSKLDAPLDEATLTPDPEDGALLALPGHRNVDDLPLGLVDKPAIDVASGIVEIPGNWYTTLVRQSDGIVIIDAPISNGYSARTIAEAARRFPGVPVKAVITTTSFAWHIAGLREYAARGIPIYVLDRNLSLIKGLLDAPHRLLPDSFSRSRNRERLIPVSRPTPVGSGDNALVIIPVRRATGQMQMVYFPGHRLLYTAEMVQPLGPGGSLLFPESLQEVTDQVKDSGISPQTMIGMHMVPTPWAKVAEALSKADGKSG